MTLLTGIGAGATRKGRPANTRTLHRLAYTPAIAPNRARPRIEIRRLISVGQDRKTGGAIIRGKGPLGADVILHVHPSQLQALANGLMGLANARAESVGD